VAVIAVVTPDLATGLALGWVAVGVALAVALHRRGQPGATALAALVVWPVLLPLLWSAAGSGAGGPNAARIDATLAALRGTLVADGGGEVDGGLTALAGALHEADARIAKVEALLAASTPADDHPGVQRARAELAAGRDRATAEIDAVLAEIVQIHLHVGLRALAGAPGDLSLRIANLEARIRALHEVEALDAIR
jgi:hypothetical protein